MRVDNGAAVWWLAPHRPAGPGGERWRRRSGVVRREGKKGRGGGRRDKE